MKNFYHCTVCTRNCGNIDVKPYRYVEISKNRISPTTKLLEKSKIPKYLREENVNHIKCDVNIVQYMCENNDILRGITTYHEEDRMYIEDLRLRIKAIIPPHINFLRMGGLLDTILVTENIDTIILQFNSCDGRSEKLLRRFIRTLSDNLECICLKFSSVVKDFFSIIELLFQDMPRNLRHKAFKAYNLYGENFDPYNTFNKYTNKKYNIKKYQGYIYFFAYSDSKKNLIEKELSNITMSSAMFDMMAMKLQYEKEYIY